MEIITFVPEKPEETDAPAFHVVRIETGHFRVYTVERNGDVRDDVVVCWSFVSAIRAAGRLMHDQFPIPYTYFCEE